MAERVPVQIIGAGPAGLMAAEIIATAGLPVRVSERMPSVGRKFLMAGRGGLNLTHSEPLDAFLSRYGAARERLAPAIRAFPPEALAAWAHGLGEETFVGSSGRVFPKSFKASPLLRAWLGRLSGLGVEIRTRRAWRGWDEAGRLLFDTPEGLVTEGARAVVLALGGASWPRLGSDGGWATLLEARGVCLAPFAPSNMGVRIPWSGLVRERFAGAPLKRIALTFGGKRVRGEAIITRTGLEGGAVYALSADVRRALQAGAPTILHVDLRPDLEEAVLARKLEAAPRKLSFANRLRRAAGLPPEAIALLREASVAGGGVPSAGAARMPSPARLDSVRLAALLKAVPLAVADTGGLDRAISSAGGLPWEELGEDYQLRRLPGVFACGEMLDFEAPTGGYLLQAAFATGVAAGCGVLAREPSSRETQSASY